MQQLTPEIIQKVLDGTASAEEQATVEAWYQACLEKGSFVEQLPKAEADKIGGKIWAEIAGSINKNPVTIASAGHKKTV